MEAGVLAAWTVILGFMGAVFQYIVLRPLNHAIEDLNGAVKELRKELQTAEERRHEMELRLVEVDQRARAAHKRIDKLEGRNTDELEHR